MSDQVQISIDREIYDRLQMLMVPPISDANAAIEALLFHEGHTSKAAARWKPANNTSRTSRNSNALSVVSTILAAAPKDAPG